MHTEPLAFLEQDLPAHFQKGVEALRAATGPTAKADLDDVLQAKGAIRLVCVGLAERWLVIDSGALTVATARPEGFVVRAALAFTEEAAKGALEMMKEAGRFDDPKGPARFARVASARAEKILASHKIEFHVVVTDLPDDAEDVVVKVAIGADTPPEKPQFTARISYDDIEDVRAGDLTPQQILGRLRLVGDASKAMALGMMLMQPPPGAPRPGAPAKK